MLTTPACPVRDRCDQCEQILRDIGAVSAAVRLTAANGAFPVRPPPLRTMNF